MLQMARYILVGSLGLSVAGCVVPMRSDTAASVHFSSAKTIELVMADESVSGRVDAINELLRILNAAPDVDAHAVYEDGSIVLEIPLGVKEDPWRVVYHLVWPEPELNNQYLNTVKLMNWSAIFKLDFATAGIARRKAHERLRDLIGEAISPAGPLHGRVRFVEAFQGVTAATPGA
jgi:hypothetical protein